MQKFIILLSDYETVIEVLAERFVWKGGKAQAFLPGCEIPVELTFEYSIWEVTENEGLDLVPSTEDSKCPGCGWEQGEGINPDCYHPDGCGYWRTLEEDEGGDEGWEEEEMLNL